MTLRPLQIDDRLFQYVLDRSLRKRCLFAVPERPNPVKESP